MLILVQWIFELLKPPTKPSTIFCSSVWIIEKISWKIILVFNIFITKIDKFSIIKINNYLFWYIKKNRGSNETAPLFIKKYSLLYEPSLGIIEKIKVNFFLFYFDNIIAD